MNKKFAPINAKRREWLKEIRKGLHLSQEEFAKKIGFISTGHYCDIEAGRRNPSLELANMLSDFLKVDINLFLNERTKFRTKAE
jgi:transcriptional regulator with XRE-family HTH domain